jgi:hypothetical protein
MRYVPVSTLPLVPSPAALDPVAEPSATYQDRTSSDPVLRRAIREERGRLRRNARRDRIRDKRAFLES